ncbi:hypothetical protein, partial [Stenotrophomonas sp. SMYL82]|uniref:hypothetical protein n=1 Tax=Stenotrophomonas sp. SMYL82 TaxID=3076048 RepID=UPI002E797317
HPAFDRFPRSVGTAYGVRSVFLRKTDLTPNFIRYLTDVSTKVDTYQQPRGTMAAVTNSRRNLSRAGLQALPNP